MDARGPRLLALSWDEFQRDTVHAVAQAGRRRPIVEDVAKMAAAAAAMHFFPYYAERVVGVGQYCAFDGLVEAWPAGAAVEFGFCIEQRQVASGASEDPGAVFIIERTGEGTLGVLFAQDQILLRCKQLAPFLRRVGDFKCARHGCAAAADQAKPNPRRTNRGDG